MRDLRRPGQQPEDVVLNGQLRIGRDHVDVVALDPHPIDHFLHGNRRCAGEDVDEHAVVARIEVLDQYEGQSRLDRNGGNELDECFETSGRCADPDDAHGGDAAVRRQLLLWTAGAVIARWSSRRAAPFAGRGAWMEFE